MRIFRRMSAFYKSFKEMKIIAILLVIAAAASAARQFRNDQVLRIIPNDDYQFDVIESLSKRWPDVDFWTEVHGSRPVDVHIPAINLPAVKAFLIKNKIEYSVFIADLQHAIDEQTSPRAAQMSLGTFDYNVYHTIEEINQWTSDIAATYSIATRSDIGKSFEGQPTYALKISSGGLNKPAFVLTCGLHSREWVSPATCLYSIKYLVENHQASDSPLNDVDFYFVPVSNPDGYEYTWTGDRMWRKTRSTGNGGPCKGVDPNRNWDINWSGPGASSSPCNDAYYGPSVMSEKEVQNLASWISNLPNVKGYIDIHAYSQYWMFPYAYTYSFTKDHDFLTTVAEESAAAITSVHGAKYTAGSISEVIYQASGSTVDYMYDKLGIKCSFAAELRDTGRYGFTLPERFIQPTAEETWEGLKVIATYITDEQCQ